MFSLEILVQAEGIYVPVPIQEHDGKIFKCFLQGSASTKISIASEMHTNSAASKNHINFLLVELPSMLS